MNAKRKTWVEPIRDWKKIEEIENLLFNEKRYRDWLMFKIGLNLALRISDLLSLKISDVYLPDMTVKSKIILREQKTGKENRLYLNKGAIQALELYRKVAEISYGQKFLFQSRQGGDRPIDRVQAYRIIKDAIKRVGLDINAGTHTLRKTWGYHAYKTFKYSLDDIMLKLNHSSLSATKRYIGLSDEDKMAIENGVVF